MKWNRLLVLLVLTAGLALAIVTPVEAHALPVSTIPEANATLQIAPTRVEIYFNQAVDPTFSKISILDTNGNRVDAGDVTLDPVDNTHLYVTMRPVGDGVYTVAWTALSATDGHLTTGSFPFAVGIENTAALANAPKVTGSANITPEEVISKGLLYVVISALMGEILFSFLVWEPSLRQTGISSLQVSGYQTNSHRLALGAILLLIVVDIARIPIQAGLASGQGILQPLDPRVASILLSTRFGTLAIARLGLALALAGLILPAQNRWNRWAGFGLCLLLALTFSLEGHAAEGNSPLLPIFADWMHVLAVSVWVGGLYHFLAGLWTTRALPAEDRTRLTAHLIPHFSSMALVSVSILAMSGLYAAILRVGSLTALVQTTYGQALIVKGLLVLPMISLGAVNLLYTSPRMRRAANEPGGNPLLVTRFRKLVIGEASLGTIILLWTGLFTSLPPAQMGSTTTGFTQIYVVADLQVALNIEPAHVGVNTFTATITSNGQPVTDAQEVSLEFNSVSGRVPPSSAQMVGIGNGTYTLQGSYLGIPDQWEIQVVTVRTDKFDAYAVYHVDLRPNASASLPVPWNQVDGALIALTGVAIFLSYLAIDTNLWRRVGLGLIPAIGLIVAGFLVYFNSPAAVPVNLVNPISPSAASIADGKAIYEQHCVECHGSSGKGDGPEGLTLNPRPADLTYHAQPGVHTDGQLFDWITNGFPGSAMPAFGQKLTDRERWDLVNYIRTLAAQPTQASP